MIERYEQVDEYTTRAVLRPDVTDPAFITSYWVPLPRHLLATRDPQQITKSEFVRRPLSYGPYMVSSFEGERLNWCAIRTTGASLHRSTQSSLRSAAIRCSCSNWYVVAGLIWHLSSNQHRHCWVNFYKRRPARTPDEYFSQCNLGAS